MAAANPLWGAPRIHGELATLGVAVSERTVSRLLRRPRRPPSQTWRTFLTNHVATLVSIDLFGVPTKICLNGHEWLKRQLTQRGIPYEPLDNGIRSSDRTAGVQRMADTLDAAKIDAVVRKWLRRLPHPFTAAHRAAGYRYQLSILQAEFALTQVLDRPRTGRGFFEEVARILTSGGPIRCR